MSQWAFAPPGYKALHDISLELEVSYMTLLRWAKMGHIKSTKIRGRVFAEVESVKRQMVGIEARRAVTAEARKGLARWRDSVRPAEERGVSPADELRALIPEIVEAVVAGIRDLFEGPKR